MFGLGLTHATVDRKIRDQNLNPSPAEATPTDVGWEGTITLAAGTFTLDLTNLPNGNLPAINMTGKIVHFFQIESDSANTDKVTIEGDATDPYELFGDAADRITTSPGDRIQVNAKGSLVAASGTVKEITFTSSDLDAVVRMVILAGD